MRIIPILGIVMCTLVPVLLPLNIWTLVNVSACVARSE